MTVELSIVDNSASVSSDFMALYNTNAVIIIIIIIIIIMYYSYE